MSCKCYHADKNFLGKIGVCWGTKEGEPCSCNGDEKKCDFYDYVRERAKKPITNADRIRAMSDEELAEWEAGGSQCPPNRYTDDYDCTNFSLCKKCWLDWLRQEAKDGSPN